MASHFSQSQIDDIVDLLDGWPPGTMLTWEALLRLVEVRLHLHPARQTLARHDRVRVAFRTRKAALRNPVQVSSDDRVLVHSVRSLRAQVDSLRAQLESSRERLARWQYNAYKHGVKRSDLETPVPHVDRGRTD